MTKQQNNTRCFSMSVYFMLGVIFAGIFFTAYENKRTVSVAIEKPIICEIQAQHWAMERLK